ncbi:MAG: hypothetical protein HQK65_12325 [Desulfamplus sp.]|nr:hypothetical protein [Desulfamplus sp.]
MDSPKFERDQLVGRYWEVRRHLSSPHRDLHTIEECKKLTAEKRQLMSEYPKYLPMVSISRCPFCNKVLNYCIDTYGFDGPWWKKGALADYSPPKGCEHFRLLLGAIDFQNYEPSEAAVVDEILPGPGVPFIIPRLLELPKMVAVISDLKLSNEYKCYLIAYFSQTPIHGAYLHQPWTREAYQVVDTNGKYQGWSISTDPWDFDLEPWIKKNKVFWIEPDDSTHILHTTLPCPYTNLSGVKAPQLIKNGKLIQLPLPTGKTLEPFE